ncbi:cytochrome c oxidase accessory protein CcoG [Thiohalobacter sp. IOR34]|uniref:cytochrome c oxidase accessory protein CcoG n=1 Tax=Thiohalobacter sp. IOR34 TaxID=3057176 RepID=UPI0025AF3A6B|nr:cytochrome c oxidase accessory protein CcoG [Thiohalobacter sp. IOR34]WJW75733.1 cytochrome c oxidase accessory protein CcoG [Thiohalobacter sp. IOR34]
MVDSGTDKLFQSRVRIYPRSVAGRFRRLKTAILLLAYGTYFLLPWLPWERRVGPPQAVLFDIEGRRFYLFDLVVHAQDIFWLAGLLVIAALLLFFVTGLAGRVFCGYFCFQTLWTDVYLFIERKLQGERVARIRLDRAPWGAEKIRKKLLTHLLWLLVAFATGLTFTLYWGYAPQLVRDFFTGQAPFAAYATTLLLTLGTYVMAGLAREQVCTYMCPYARFQGVMFDRDTLVVAYDSKRGEGAAGRQRVRRGLKTAEERQAAGVGDCIDCGFCVQVCPTGIDIRDGLQYQCISCALCIDACDTIMDSLGWPRGLVKYTSEKAQRGGKTRLLKAKNIGYALVLVAAIAALAASIIGQAPLELSVAQVRQPLAVMLSDGRIQNSYEIKINNKTDRRLALRLELEGLVGAELDLGQVQGIELAPEQSLRLLARVRLRPAVARSGRQAFRFVLTPLDPAAGTPLQEPAMFYLPEAR